MRAADAGRTFVRMVREAQLAPDDLAGHVAVFRRFAALTVADVSAEPEDDSDLLLFESLTADGVLHWGVDRQLFAEDEPVTMGIEATFDLDDELRGLPTAQTWGTGGESAADFFAEIERLPAWTAAMRRRPSSLEAIADIE